MSFTCRYIAFTLAIFATTILSCKEKGAGSAPPAQSRANAPVQAEAFLVRTKPLSENIEVPGSLLPFETTEIRPEISGRVVSLNIPEGRAVRKGALLAQLFDGDLQAQLKKLQVQLSIAEKTAERYNELVKIQGISQQEYDLSELQVSNLKADIQLIQVDIDRTRITAPYAGLVGLRSVSNGAYITPTTVITTISQVNDLKLEFTVPEKYSDDMRAGKQVQFMVNDADRRFVANVMATENIIEANTRSLRVRAVVKGDNPSLVPGAFAKVSLQLGKDNEAMIIPTQAVIPQAREKKAIVMKGGVPTFVTVVTGIRDSSFVQVLEGLNVGDTVLTSGLLAIRPESKVAITKIN